MRRSPIFICYRHVDKPWAGRLEAELSTRFGADAVFRDRTIPAGVNWRTYIDDALDSCDVMLVLIGPSWVAPTAGQGVNRLWEADDVVRREIERGLQRADVHVIPVLLDGTQVPSAEQLPPGLHALCDVQGAALGDSHWDVDVERLVARVATIVPLRKSPPERGPARIPSRAAVGIIAAAAGATLIAQPLSETISPSRPGPSGAARFTSEWVTTTLERLAGIMGERAVMWAIVAAFALGVAYVVISRVRSGAPAGVAIGLASGALAGAVGGFVYVALKDVAQVTSEFLLNGASVAVVGALLAGRFAQLSGSDDVGAYRTIGLGGGLVAGVVARLAYEGHVAPALVFAVQSALLVGAFAALLIAPSLTQPAPAPGAVDARF
jgi:hypothetical protein